MKQKKYLTAITLLMVFCMILVISYCYYTVDEENINYDIEMWLLASTSNASSEIHFLDSYIVYSGNFISGYIESENKYNSFLVGYKKAPFINRYRRSSGQVESDPESNVNRASLTTFLHRYSASASYNDGLITITSTNRYSSVFSLFIVILGYTFLIVVLNRHRRSV